MKKFDLISMIVFTILAIVTFIGGFYNWFHFVFCAMCLILVGAAYMEYREQDEEN